MDRRASWLRFVIVCAMGIVASACGGGSKSRTDSGVDAGGDAHVATDAGADSGTDAGTDSGTDAGLDAAADAGCTGAACPCSAPNVDVIYLVDDAYHLQRFDPRLIGMVGGPYHDVGSIACTNVGTPIGGSGVATPRSIAIDHGENDAGGVPSAWVLYDSGKIFQVSTADASCQATSFVVSQSTPPETWDLFGMAFTADAAGSTAETLWLGGGNADFSLPGSLGTVSLGTMAVTYVAPIAPTSNQLAGLAGVGDATLWGFFLNVGSDSFIQQLDRATGAAVGSALAFPLVTSGRSPQAWAFAHRGGTFYVFVTSADSGTGLNPRADVETVARANGAHATVLSNQAVTVIAAGASTCAPSM